MLINLVPDFLAVLNHQDQDRLAAYREYFAAHQQLLQAYWHNYVLDPDGPHFDDVVRTILFADRSDLRAMLDRTDVITLAQEAIDRCSQALDIDVGVDVILMVGVGAANAGELVVGGRPAAFVCLEHFTSVQNESTHGLGLDPELIPLWIGHEIAHAVRYTSPTSRSEFRALIDEEGYYSYWDSGQRIPLRELLLNEGLAIDTSKLVSPGHAEWEYYGYSRRHYARVREFEPVLNRIIAPDLERAGLGLRLRYLSGGLSDDGRQVGSYVVPERAGYYLGHQLSSRAVAAYGLPWAIRASAAELMTVAAAVATA
jgi:hypothetical protein